LPAGSRVKVAQQDFPLQLSNELITCKRSISCAVITRLPGISATGG